MAKIQISLVAKNYANSLVEIAQAGLVTHNEIFANLDTIKKILTSSMDLQKTLKNPTIDDKTKFAIIDEVFKNSINQKIIDFFKIIIEKKRFDEFAKIIVAYQLELDKINNIQRVEIISAIELSEEKRSAIVDKLQQKLLKNVIPTWSIDDSIIAGLIVEIDDNVIDTSLRTKLEKMNLSISKGRHKL